MTRSLARFLKALCLLGTRRYRVALWAGVGAGVQHAPLLKALSPRLIVDVGANRGQFLLAALESCPDAAIQVVEPQPAALARLTSWLNRCATADRNRVALHGVAVAEHEGEATLHVSWRDDNSSLLEPTDEQLRLFPDTGIRGHITVPVTRLDHLLRATPIPPDSLLKIDVQGAEGAVLEGAAGILDRFRWVYVESSQRELYRGQSLATAVAGQLAEFGFQLVSSHNGVNDRDGTLVQADHLFERR
jgi:FkbM family methyltransferase